MDPIGSDGLKAILAFRVLRLEFGWSTTPPGLEKLTNLPWHEEREARQMEMVMTGLLN